MAKVLSPVMGGAMNYDKEIDLILTKLENIVELSTVARMNGRTYNNRTAHSKAKQALIELVANKNKSVDRFEVIDDTGRAYVKGSIYGSPVSVELSYQDDDRTLKVFVTELTKEVK